MKKLLKFYDLKNVTDYYDIIMESLINGQFVQAKEQFKKLPKTHNKDFLLYVHENYQNFKQVLNHLL